MTPDELRAALVGAWRLVSYEARGVDGGEVVRPFGDRPLGLIIYSADGYMSAQITRPDRPRFDTDRLESGRPEELTEAARNYLAYAGPFRVQDGQTVIHDVALSLFPNWMGGAQLRVARLDGEVLQLALATPTRIWGALRTGVLTWERVGRGGG
ncbi:lipocalin-like domain-containing protein [Streptomyces sp. NPDC001822]|uniref:lipocalin-like domain-containing protein n=1 Tax=Streptomyces sp. NPDC001822 TaxID=3364614 RepID=UPI00369B49AD